MNLIEWTEDLRLGVTVIDRQHERLIGIVNRLSKAHNDGSAAEIISDIIDELIIYTASHFSLEEEYFDQFRYASAEEHKAEHEALIGKVTQFANAFNRGSTEGRPVLAGELLEFLDIWLRYHMMVTDAKFVSLFRERGLT